MAKNKTGSRTPRGRDGRRITAGVPQDATKKDAAPSKPKRKGKGTVGSPAKQRPQIPAKPKASKGNHGKRARAEDAQRERRGGDTQRVSTLTGLRGGIWVDDVRAVVKEELKAFRISLVKSLQRTLSRSAVAGTDAAPGDEGEPQSEVPPRSATTGVVGPGTDAAIKESKERDAGEEERARPVAVATTEGPREKDVVADYRTLCDYCKTSAKVLVSKVETALCGLLVRGALPGATNSGDEIWPEIGDVRTVKKVRGLLTALELVKADIKRVTKTRVSTGLKHDEDYWKNTRLTEKGAALAQYIRSRDLPVLPVRRPVELPRVNVESDAKEDGAEFG